MNSIERRHLRHIRLNRNLGILTRPGCTVEVLEQGQAPYLGERSKQPLTCSGVWRKEEPLPPSVSSALVSSSSSEVLLSPKSSKCSSSPPITIPREWPWSSEVRENLGEAEGGKLRDCVCVSYYRIPQRYRSIMIPNKCNCAAKRFLIVVESYIPKCTGQQLVLIA